MTLVELLLQASLQTTVRTVADLTVGEVGLQEGAQGGNALWEEGLLQVCPAQLLLQLSSRLYSCRLVQSIPQLCCQGIVVGDARQVGEVAAYQTSLFAVLCSYICQQSGALPIAQYAVV